MVQITSILATALATSLVAGQSSGYKSCDALIDAGLGDSVLFASSRGGDYSRSLGSYYSKTVSEILPWCILQPKSTEEVSKAIKALAPLSAAGQWHVAVRGAGHSHWANNNIAQGVTIDLAQLNTTTVHLSNCGNSTHVASIGAGSRWGNVLAETEKYGLGVTGGRVAGVGVAGLVLGGGASFMSGKRGFSCDDVVNYEVVLADGSIVNANKGENQRLFKALKGGGSNFGIVTRFDMAAYPAGDLYGGIFITTWDHRETVVNTLINVVKDNQDHPADSQIAMYQYRSDQGFPMVGSIPVNVDGDANSPRFTALESIPKLVDLRRKWSYGAMIQSMNDSGGQRYVWFSLSFHADKRILDKAAESFLAVVAEIKATFPDQYVSLNYVFQPLPRSWAKVNPGGNVLGVDETLKEDSIIWLGQCFVNTPEFEAWFHAKLGVVSAELEAFAESVGANTPWRYMNYVSPTQDPIKSYGAQNVAFIRDVAKEYDPTGFFQTRVNGGFKISSVV
ncbi:FAD binding domain-containing protein [Plectosphaerella plurivora]|uniref:FAD binding domain-containing protein n=1 Tax=Plectosphaerella plurivora TaxID=936078 RepID=A0A9P9AG45_9PEZI|nr:FAD binding domain-containing protein [Plectosphaerella plurivora]